MKEFCDCIGAEKVGGMANFMALWGHLTNDFENAWKTCDKDGSGDISLAEFKSNLPTLVQRAQTMAKDIPKILAANAANSRAEEKSLYSICSFSLDTDVLLLSLELSGSDRLFCLLKQSPGVTPADLDVLASAAKKYPDTCAPIDFDDARDETEAGLKKLGAIIRNSITMFGNDNLSDV